MQNMESAAYRVALGVRPFFILHSYFFISGKAVHHCDALLEPVHS